MRKKLRTNNQSVSNLLSASGEDKSSVKRQFLNSLRWRSIDLAEANLGEFDDSVFFGLEEVDGEELAALNNIKNVHSEEVQSTTIDEVKDSKKRKRSESTSDDSRAKSVVSIQSHPLVVNKLPWGSTDNEEILVSECLHQALLESEFHVPTPIQRLTIPLVAGNNLHDIIGVAETGSGKTLVR